MKKILIIDDSVETADLLAVILEMSGHTALAVHGAMAGLQAMHKFKPDIVFLDIGMPELNGYEVAARIRSDPDFKQPFLIAFTAWNDSASIEKAMRVGFDCHITKTSPFEKLMEAIQSTIT